MAQGIFTPHIGQFTFPDTCFSDVDLCYQFPYLVFGEKVIFVVTPENRNQLPVNGRTVDYVLLHHNPYIKVEKLLETFPNAVFVADNTNSWKSNSYWKLKFDGSGVHFHSLRDQGALEVGM